jgi:hypothetical protein
VAELRFKPEDVVKLSVKLSEELIVLRSYGKTGDDIPAITEAFLSKFKQHDPQKVIGAIEQWGLTGTGDFPTPPDIEAILNPKPKYDYAVYQRLLKRNKDGEYMTAREFKYIQMYEENAMKGL